MTERETIPRIPEGALLGEEIRFYFTRSSPCPYLPGRQERKIFAQLLEPDGARLNHSLALSGFRRSQRIAYRPVCEGCSACTSVRIPVTDFRPDRNQRRVVLRNQDLMCEVLPPRALRTHYALLKSYLSDRHGGGGMTDMRFRDFTAMVEDSPVETFLLEYRTSHGELLAVALSDRVPDGLSMVYSFFAPSRHRRSLGTFMILDHVTRAAERNLPYVYLGYWVPGSPKMAYKGQFRPLELFASGGWRRLERGQRHSDLKD